MNSIDLNGRRAIVTGAAQGLGRAIGERLQASGAAVYVWDFDSCRYEGSPGGLARRWPCRVGSKSMFRISDAVEAALRETQASAGGIDILVNNAGISGPNMPTWEYPVDDWRRVIDIDLNGPLPGEPRRGAANEGRWLGADRQHRLGGRQGGQPPTRRPTARRRAA